jgi:Leucine-rich repeat (LRR) protein
MPHLHTNVTQPFAHQILDLSHNGLTDLPAEVCEGLPKITVLDLSHNRFQQCPSAALGKLTTLR